MISRDASHLFCLIKFIFILYVICSSKLHMRLQILRQDYVSLPEITHMTRIFKITWDYRDT